ncbi:NHS-like protein 3 [Brachyistius frenatus]|uniref:NHS-like protein 3 n=1 Tax=Brachyistius frenatus TaxID=100188 RepID=UPI0037E99150
MSNRDSLGFGELLPQDVVDIFSHEKHSKRSRKKRSRSLGRALGWLKGKKRKDPGANGKSLGLGPALDLALDGRLAGHQGGHKGGHKSGRQAHPQGNTHAVPKRNDDDKTPVPPLFQENVFMESSRPKYLEDLHTEALEGLKMMQQEETNNGVEYQDNESTVSTMTVQTDGEGFVTDSTIADTSSIVSVQSSVSTRSSRSGLTRQGSTFRPLNSGKKSKTRRRHRKTVVGIPQHVQREMGLDRVGWTLTRKLDEEQLYNGDTDSSPTTDGPQQAAESQNGVEQLGATRAGHRDDLALLHRLGPNMEGEQRPRSLAVPWMTTASSLQQEPPSPVISMSPQAAYMSKIIPNAVLPPSVEVVEINRGQSRNSLRTVSKSSLVLSSPAPSRASSRASSIRTTSSRASTITSASRYNLPNMSDSSGWSNSESSETLVSDTSTISSSSTPRQKRSQDGDASARDDKISLQSSISKASKCTSNGKLIHKRDEVEREGQFVRSLSVMKSKRAPPPPSRSYSLHNKMKRRSRDLAEVLVISSPGEENENNKPGSPSRIVDSLGYNADTSSLEDSMGSVSFSALKTQLQVQQTEVAETDSKNASQEKQEPPMENKINKIISPSSGYSSQHGTSPQLSKQPHSSSPKHKKGILAKLQRLFPGSTSAGSAPSRATRPEASNTKSTEEPKLDTVDTICVSPSVRTLRELFNIPPHPKVHAPPAPPPEVWAHNKRTVELLLGPPAPDHTYAIVKKNPKDRRQQRQPPSVSAEMSVKSSVVERNHKNPTVAAQSVNGSLHVPEAKTVQESQILNAESHKESNGRLAQNVDLEGSRKDEKVRVSDILGGMLVKAVEKREERLAAIREEESKTSAQATDVKSNVDTSPAVSLVRISPSTSPPPTHLPLQPPATQTTNVASVTSVQVVVSHESSWPPPPPPMAQVGLSEETDYLLPPPPLFGAEGPDLPVQEQPEKSDSFSTAVTSEVKTESVKVITGAEPQKPSTSQEMAPPPLSIPPPPPYSAPRPPPTAVLSSTTEKVSPPPREVSPPAPKEISPPLVNDLPVRPKEPSAPVVQDVLPLVKDITSTLVTEVSPSAVQEVSPPLLIEVSHLPPKEVSKVVIPPPPREDAPRSSEEATIVSKLTPPQIIPPPPPLPSQPESSEEEIDPPQENIPFEPETEPVSSNSILAPPQSIPPPPPVELLRQRQVVPDGPSTQEAPSLPPSEVSKPPAPETSPPPEEAQEPAPSPQEAPSSPPSEVSKPPAPETSPPPEEAQEPAPSPQEVPSSPPSQVSKPPAPETSPPEKAQEPAPSPPTNIPLPPPLPVQALTSVKLQPGPLSTENQEQTSDPVVPEEPTPIVTPSLLQMVQLQSVNSSPEPPKAQEQPQAEVTMRKRQPDNEVPTPSASGETPQKPIRRSLIVTAPTSTSPLATVTSQPTLPTTQSSLISPASSSTAVSPMKKSPPAMTASPSMNLQEAIRLRTAARSKDSPLSRLSLHLPTSPLDLHKSPSSTGSFSFSKSNKTVVTDTRPMPETKEDMQKNPAGSSVTKEISDAESLKTGVKVPPPVAKKPKTKAKEVETSEGTEQTAGQEPQQDSVKGDAEMRNGTAGTVEEGGGTSLT